jgi:predicted permease
MSRLSRLLNVFRADRVADDLDDELRFHLESTIEQLVAEGRTPEDAAREARLRLGNALALRERSRDIKLLPWLEALARDVGIGARMLRKDAVAAVAAAMSLGLAMGACTAAFMLVDALLLRELPVREPHRLVYLAMPTSLPPPAQEGASFNYPLFERLRDAGAGRVQLMVVSYQDTQRARLHDAPTHEERVGLQFVSGVFFESLGIVPEVGRVITPADDRRGAANRVAVLSHAFWRRRFGADPSVIGRLVTFEDQARYEIVGVAREGFTGVEPGLLTDVWVPATTFQAEALVNPGQQWFRVWGRLAPGATPGDAKQPLQPVFTQFRRERAARFPPDGRTAERARYINQELVLRSAATGPSFLRLDFEGPLLVLTAIAALVLLLACSNVANLLLARGAGRGREMALRLAIGSSRARLVQQLLVEGFLLAGAACAVGVLVAAVAAPRIVDLLSTSATSIYLALRFDWRVVAFVTALGLSTTLLFGLMPAFLASRVAPLETLKSGGRQHTRARLLQPLVSAQVGISLTVVFLAGLLLLSFHRLANVDAGFVPDGLILADVETVDRVGGEHGKRALLDLLSRVRARTGIADASLSAWPLLRGWEWTAGIRVNGRMHRTEITILEVSPGFMKTMGIRARDGRDFTAADLEPTEPRVALVNEAFTRVIFPDASGRVLGRQFERVDGTNSVPQEIVGVVGDAKYRTLREDASPVVYIPLRDRRGGTLQLRTSMPADAVASLLQSEAARSTPALTVTDVVLQSRLVDNTLLHDRLLAMLAGFFAMVSLALAAIGLYGVLSFTVVQRTREIGIRLALGATARAVIGHVVGSLAFYGGLGVACGVAAGLYAARFVKTLLYEVEPLEPTSLLLPVAGLMIVGLIAALAPARRAASVDPMVALRDE